MANEELVKGELASAQDGLHFLNLLLGEDTFLLGGFDNLVSDLLLHLVDLHKQSLHLEAPLLQLLCLLLHLIGVMQIHFFHFLLVLVF